MAETEIAKLTILLEAKLREFVANMQSASGEIKSFANKAKTDLSGLDGLFATMKEHWKSITAAIGSAVVAYKTITSSVGAMVELGSQTLQLQRMTGMTAKEASTLIAVGNQLGITYETISASVVNVARRMGALKDIESVTIDETGKAVDVFKKFGIEVKDAEGKARPFAEVFEEIRKAVQRSNEPLAVATQFLRQSAREMLPLLMMSREEFRKLAEEAEKYGLVLTPGNVNAVRTYVLAQNNLKDAYTGLKLVLGQELIPALTESAKAMAENIRQVRTFVNEYRSFLSLPWDVLKTIKENWQLILAALAPILTVALVPVITGWIAAFGALIPAIALTATQFQVLAAAVGLLMGYEIGKLVDKLVYWLSGGKIDITGLNAVRKAQEQIAEQMAFLAKRADETAEKLQKLGFVGPNAMRDFNNAVRAGTVVWDAAAKSWKKVAEDMEAPNPKLEAAIDKIVKKTEELRIEMTRLTDPEKANAMALELFIAEVTKGVPMTEALRKAIADLKSEFLTLQEKIQTQKVEEAYKKLTDKAIELGIEIMRLKDPIKAEDEAFQNLVKSMVAGIAVDEAMMGEIDNLVLRFREWQKAMELKRGEEALKAVADRTEELGVELVRLEDPVRADMLAFEGWIGKLLESVPATHALLNSIEEMRNTFRLLQEEKTRRASEEAERKASLADFKSGLETEAALLRENYDKGLVQTANYYRMRRWMAEETTAREIRGIEEEIAKTADQARKKDLVSQIYVKTQELLRTLIGLRREEAEADKKNAEEKIRLQDIVLQGQIKELGIRERRLEISPREALAGELALYERQTELLKELEREYGRLGDRAAAEIVKKRLEDIRDKIIDISGRLKEYTGTFWEGMIDGAKKAGYEITDYRTGMEAMQKTISNVGDSFKSVFVDFMRGQLKTFGDYWRAFCDGMYDIFGDVLKAMVKEWITAQITMKATAVGGAGFWGWLGGFFGVGAGAEAPAFAAEALMAHGGGTIGQTSLPIKEVMASVFANAPRLHSGLAPDEYPAILQYGEKVTPRGQSEAPVINIEIQNQTGAPVTAKQGKMVWDNAAKAWVVGVVLESLGTGGDLRNALMGIAPRG